MTRALRFVLRLLCPRDRREDLEGDLFELLETRRPPLLLVRDVVSVVMMLLAARCRAIRPRGLGRDVSLAWRTLRRQPGFSVAVIATLGLGIGANTAIFSLVNAVLLRVMPVRDPSALVLFNVSTDRSGLGSSFPYPFYRQLRDSPVLDGVICEAGTSPNIEAGGPPERVSGKLVSLNYFDVLGVRAHIGRVFAEGDERQPGGDRVVVLTYGYWQRRFGGDAAVIGRTIRVNTQPMTIIGVTVRGFDGLELGGVADVRVPITMQPLVDGSASRLESPQEWFLQILGRLKPGVTRDQAERAVAVDYQTFTAATASRGNAAVRPAENHLTLLDGSRGRQTIQRRFREPLAILAVLAAVVLALVCLNVANLMLARNAARQKELSVTLALGAGRGRLVQQMVVEALLLAAIGGAIGLLLSVWSARALAKIAIPAQNGPIVDVPLDWRLMVFAAATATAAAILCALGPALLAAKTNLSAVLGAEGRHVIGGRLLGRRVLVGVQMALSLAVLLGAGLFVRTLANLTRLDVGYDIRHLALFTLNPSLGGYGQDRVRLYYEELIAKVSTMPGARGATLAMMPLLDVSRWGSGLTLDTGEQDNRPGPLRNAVGPGYFRFVGMRIVEGREFSAADRPGTMAVAVVNEAFVRRYFPDGRALGRRIGPGGAPGPAAITIVGVVADSRVLHVREAPAPFWYVPYMQLGRVTQLTLHVQTDADPEPLMPDLLQAIRAVDSGVTVFRGRTMTRQVSDQIVAERLLATLATGFGLISAALAAIGLYGVLSFVTAARRREIALRMALGATPRSILGLVAGQTCVLVLAGLGGGSILGLVLARKVQTFLFGIDGLDAPTIAIAAGLLLSVTIVATLLPARRAARIDPMSGLH
jgi:predicted permease